VRSTGVDGAVELVPDRDVAVADVRLARPLARLQPQLVLQRPARGEQRAHRRGDLPHRLRAASAAPPLVPWVVGRTGEPWLRERTPASAKRGGAYVGFSASTHWSNMISPER
jgi:hypothetical protein